MRVPWHIAYRAVMAVLFASMRPACAHTLSESYSSWHISDASVRVQFTIPDLEARRLSDSGKEQPSNQQLADYLAAHLGATSDGSPCLRTEGPRTLSAIAGFRRFELVYSCPAASDLKLRCAVLYDHVPSHTNFARIVDNNGTLFEQLFTHDHQQIDVSGGAAQNTLENAGLLTFIGMGIMHIFTGIDHMSFMLGLVLISRRLRDLLFVVTGFTIGHSLTLGLAVTGVLRPNAQYIDALVALTIALIGAENIGDSIRRPLPVALSLGGLLFCFALANFLGLGVVLPAVLLVGAAMFSLFYLLLTGHMNDAGRIRLLMTLVFGLIHGFGFASNLLQMQLPAHRLAPLLFGFNVGVEIGQVSVVLTALLLTSLLVRLRLAIPRALLTDIAAAFLVGEGLFWFVGRSVVLA
jgi:hypothetical protein